MQRRRHLAEAARVPWQPVGVGAERVERELPAVPVRRHEPLQDRQRRLERPALVGDVALQSGDVREAPVCEEAKHLQLRIHPRLDPPVELEREPLVEDERAVRLLGAHRPDTLDLVGQRSGAAEDDRRRPDVERLARAKQVDDAADQLAVGDRVVRDPALRLRDDLLVPAAVAGPEAQRHVVEVVRLEPVADLDDREGKDRRAPRDDAGIEHAGVEDVARLAAEPALRGDRPQQDEAVEEVEVAALDPVLELSRHRRDPGAGTRRSHVGRA